MSKDEEIEDLKKQIKKLERERDVAIHTRDDHFRNTQRLARRSAQAEAALAICRKFLEDTVTDPEVIAFMEKTLTPTLDLAKISEAIEAQATLYYLTKWIERGLFDAKTATPREALLVIAHHPGMPWYKGRWDVDHLPYAKEFYKEFPKAKGK